MKTLVLTLVMLGGISVAKAQQWQLSPNNKLPLNTYKFKSDTTLNKLFKRKADSLNMLGTLTNVKLSATAAINMDHMPIAKLNNTDPQMPIVQTDKTGYTMPVLGKGLPRVYMMNTSPAVIIGGKKP